MIQPAFSSLQQPSLTFQHNSDVQLVKRIGNKLKAVRLKRNITPHKKGNTCLVVSIYHKTE